MSRSEAVPPEGSPADFESLFRAQRGDVERLCRRLMGGERAGDALQETYLRARRGFSGYQPERPFRGWLLAVASHLCIDLLRRESREGRLFEPEDLSPAGLSDPAPSPLERALQVEERELLLAAIDALPPRFRLPLVLRYYEDLDYRGLAERLALPLNQVGTLLYRARRQLRAALAEETP